MSMTQTKFRNYWIDFWKISTTPKHRRDQSDFYQEHAADLRLLFGNRCPGTVLELCCGNGALYPYLGFGQAEYRGVDFSSSMLSEFSRAYPRVDLTQGDVTDYRDDRSYDLILMEFAAGHFTPAMLAQVFRNVRAMMHPDSMFVCSSIPWRRTRWDFYRGLLTPPNRGSFRRLMRARVKTLLQIPDPIGAWYDPSDIEQLAAQAGLSARYHGCHSYIYRFHARLTLARTDVEGSVSLNP